LSELRATASVVSCWSHCWWNALGVVASSVNEEKHSDHCFPFAFASIQPFRLSPPAFVIRREPGK
jgi:hypothetical protein